MIVQPVDLATANQFVHAWHRHSKPVQGHLVLPGSPKPATSTPAPCTPPSERTTPMMSDYQPDYIKGIAYAKRLTIQHTPWMGDWFTSHSPRNDNSNAEGQWGQWVNLAVSILQHPATAITDPEAHQAAQGLTVHRYYSEVGRTLTDDEIATLFGGNHE